MSDVTSTKIGQDTSVSFEKILNTTGYLSYRIEGVSMRPLLRQGLDVVQIIKKGTGRCKKFDAVLYKVKDKYILHRIIEVRETEYVILGDNCLRKEYGITDEQILGVLIGIIKNGKHIRTTDKAYLLYVHLWCAIYPLRVIIKFINAQLDRLRRLARRDSKF